MVLRVREKSLSPGRERNRVAPQQEDVYIDVPPGTVVRRKRSGELLGGDGGANAETSVVDQPTGTTGLKGFSGFSSSKRKERL